jgi:hypothetical protein
MVKFDIELVRMMRAALDDVMTMVPAEYSTSATKAVLAEYILKIAANGETSYGAFVAAAASYVPEAVRVVFG